MAVADNESKIQRRLRLLAALQTLSTPTLGQRAANFIYSEFSGAAAINMANTPLQVSIGNQLCTAGSKSTSTLGVIG